MAPAKFITFEGGEGAGKTTQARLLAEHLRSAGIEVVVTREPGGSPFAERIRDLLLDPTTPPRVPLSEALLFYAARADHLERTIRPALADGKWVICDRFSDSTRVYQGIVGGLEPATLDALERLVVEPTVPNLTFVIDLDVVIGLARADQRRVASTPGLSVSADPYESRTVLYHEKLRQGFLTLARADTRRCVVIEGFQPVNEMARQIAGHADVRLRPRSR